MVQREINYKLRIGMKEQFCFYVDRDKTKGTVDINEYECLNIRSFRTITVNELQFEKFIDLKNVTNLFIDIDEVYYGVESGVQRYMKECIS